MKVVKVIALGLMVLMFSSVSPARGVDGGAGEGQMRDQTSDQTRDQTRSKTQDKKRLHAPGTGTTTPATAPTSN